MPSHNEQDGVSTATAGWSTSGPGDNATYSDFTKSFEKSVTGGAAGIDSRTQYGTENIESDYYMESDGLTKLGQHGRSESFMRRLKRRFYRVLGISLV